MTFQYFPQRKTQVEALDSAKRFCTSHMYLMFRFGMGYDWTLIHTKYTIMRIRRKNAN